MAEKQNTTETATTTARPGRKPVAGVRISARIGEGLYESIEEMRWEGRYEKVDYVIEELLDEAVQARKGVK